MNNLLLPLPVLLPLMAALLALLAPRAAAMTGLLAAWATLLVAVMLLLQLESSAVHQLLLGSWPQGLGIRLWLDGVSALFLLMSALLYLLLSSYAEQYFRALMQRSDFWVLWGMLFTALHGLFLSGDLFNLYVTLELLSISAVGLILLAQSSTALKSAGRYLAVSLLGSLLFLAGVSLIIAAKGSADIQLLKTQLAADPQSWLAFLLMNAGLMLKTALFPVHFWLPATHAVAPAPISAALSALVVKACFFLLMRLWLDLFLPVLSGAVVMLIGIVAIAAILIGSWQALIAARLKHLAAWSTVAQIGYLSLFIPLLYASRGSDTYLNLFGALVLMALSHGLAKSALFLSVGQIQNQFGHDEIARLNGLAKRLPVTCFGLALAGIVLVGLPPGGGFLAKWILISAAVEVNQWWIVLAIGLGTLGAAAYLFRLLSIAFSNQSEASISRSSTSTATTPLQGELPGLLLALSASVALGLFAYPLWQTVSQAGWGL